MSEVTHEQVNLLLRLYEERREPRLREARDWFANNFHAQTLEEVRALCPPGTRENVNVRMVLGYWEMVASIANRGLIDEDFFFENTGEHWGVFEQVKPVLAAWRAAFSSPNFLSNLEKNSARLEAWREQRSPGSNETIRKMMEQFRQAAQASKAQAASATD